jgi:hypothetical protein
MAGMRSLACSLALLLGGCGGGYAVWFSYGGNFPPSISLAADEASAAPRTVVHLKAITHDDLGVARVDFFRVAPDGSRVSLARDLEAPWSLDTAMPDTPADSVIYVAVATDGLGQSAESNEVEVAVLR